MNSADGGTDTDATDGPSAASATAADVRATPLFIDTGAFFAYYNDRDEHHDTARAVFQAIRTGELPYSPLYTTRFVLAELATLLLYKVDHATATRALGNIFEGSSFNITRADPSAFADAREEFDQYDDQEITFVDHLTGVLAAELDVDHVFAFDDDFRTLGFTVVPEDTGGP
jgi:predicted nucleic acid-binding protein